jgi:Ala-tRNA(Pro) deacylase
MLTPETLEELLREKGVAFVTHRHPPVHTVEESKALRGSLTGGHTKNLFLKDKKGRHFLLTLEEDAEVDLKTIHHRIGAQGRVSFGRPEAMQEFLGVQPGAVTLFGPLNDKNHDVTVFVDEALLAFDVINCHPLTNEATTAIAPRDLLAVLAESGHKAHILKRESPDQPRD